jgi:hypothetical protein
LIGRNTKHRSSIAGHLHRQRGSAQALLGDVVLDSLAFGIGGCLVGISISRCIGGSGSIAMEQLLASFFDELKKTHNDLLEYTTGNGTASGA